MHFSRNDGIVIGITCVQWILEILVSLLVGILHIFKGENRVGEHFLTLFLAWFSYVILPAFYLMADSRFRTDFNEKGLCKALLNAFFQKY